MQQRGPGPAPVAAWRVKTLTAAVLAVLTIAVFVGTLRNQFLQLAFDDSLILDTPALHGLNWPNLRALATDSYQAHYVPLTMLSLAIDYHFWGPNPWGYHATNVLLHATTVLLLYFFLCSIVSSVRVAALAAAIFAVHPVQMEAVSLAIQRKTVLAGALWFTTLIVYQRWHRTGSRGWYAVSFLSFVAAALAKPAVVSLPFLLLLYDYVTTGRMRLRPLLPFFAVAGSAAGMAVRAHAAVGAVYALHGGNLLAHLLMVSRVMLEYVDAAFLPLNLSPIYYYPIAAIYRPINFLALALIPTVCVYVTLFRHRYRWSFFCFWWFTLALLPESNLLPLAQLRADRFLYLALPAFALWVACGWERLLQATDATCWRRPVVLVTFVAVALLGFTCYLSAAVWHDDLSAWTRVVERHPWCAVAHQMLGRAYYGDGDSMNAERELRAALGLSGRLPDTHLYLAKIYAGRGATEQARIHLQRFLEMAPGNPEGLALLSAITDGGGA